MHGLCVCVVLKEAPRARAQYARACEANTWALAAHRLCERSHRTGPSGQAAAAARLSSYWPSASAPTGQVPAARRRRRPGSPPSGSSASAPTEQVPASRRRRRPGSPPSGARRGRRPWRPGRMSATSAARAPRGAAARRAPWPRGSLCGVSCNATRTIKGEYASCQRVGRPSSPRGVCQSCTATPNSARRARVGHSACVVRALAMGPATQAARMHSGRESPGKKS